MAEWLEVNARAGSSIDTQAATFAPDCPVRRALSGWLGGE